MFFALSYQNFKLNLLFENLTNFECFYGLRIKIFKYEEFGVQKSF